MHGLEYDSAIQGSANEAVVIQRSTVMPTACRAQ